MWVSTMLHLQSWNTVGAYIPKDEKTNKITSWVFQTVSVNVYQGYTRLNIYSKNLLQKNTQKWSTHFTFDYISAGFLITLVILTYFNQYTAKSQIGWQNGLNRVLERIFNFVHPYFHIQVSPEKQSLCHCWWPQISNILMGNCQNFQNEEGKYLRVSQALGPFLGWCPKESTAIYLNLPYKLTTQLSFRVWRFTNWTLHRGESL